jgi:uncharacterized membrane protein
METGFWTQVHGAVTHFPIALTLCSGAFDVAGLAMARRPIARDLTAVGYWSMLLGALGSLPAVISGLVMTKGVILGHGMLRRHHLFAWPAFTLLLALATWRLVAGQQMPRGMFAGYLAVTAITIGLIVVTGYWGGEMLVAR